MKTVDDLQRGDYVAFGFNYNGGEPNEIIVDSISSVSETQVLVHFLYGYKSMGEWINKADIIAIGNDKGSGWVPGYQGTFDVIQPDHKLLYP